jgi:hypothetical protein
MQGDSREDMEQQLYSTAAERQQQTVTTIEGMTGHKQLLTKSACMTTVAKKHVCVNGAGITTAAGITITGMTTAAQIRLLG